MELLLMATLLQKYCNFNDRVRPSPCGRSVATSRLRGHDTRTQTPTSRWTFSANSSRTNSIEMCFRRSTTSRSSPGQSPFSQYTGGGTRRPRTCDSTVVGSIPGRSTIGRLVLGWVTVFGRAYYLGT